MTSMTTRRKFSKEFKSKVVLEALKERETLEGLAKKYELQPTQISLWKTQAMRNFSNLFSKDNEKDKEEDVEIQQLYAQIGKLQVQNEFLKKKL
jgi:transposase-like protein